MSQAPALSVEELRALAEELRADHGLWQPLVRHSPDTRHYELLRHDDAHTWSSRAERSGANRSRTPKSCGR